MTDLSAAEAQYVTTLKQLCPQIAQAQDLLLQFRTLLQEPDSTKFDQWLERSEQSAISEVVGFSQGLRRDSAAVKAACSSPWSHDYAAYCTSSLEWRSLRGGRSLWEREETGPSVIVDSAEQETAMIAPPHPGDGDSTSLSDLGCRQPALLTQHRIPIGQTMMSA